MFRRNSLDLFKMGGSEEGSDVIASNGIA